MIAEHKYLAPGPDVRCVHCGTRQAHHAMIAQPCVPRYGQGEAPRPVPALRVAGVYDAETISARIAELRAERQEILNTPLAEPT